MKIKEIHDELMELAKAKGFTVRKENGKFKSSNCVIHDQKLIILNKTTPVETAVKVLAKSLAAVDLSDTFIKPAVREAIDAESQLFPNEKEFNLVVNY